MMAWLTNLMRRIRRQRHSDSCDNCAFVEFFRSNGDGQVPRLHAFCRCPGGPFQDRPLPPARRCVCWQPSAGPVDVPTVGDPTLTV